MQIEQLFFLLFFAGLYRHLRRFVFIYRFVCMFSVAFFLLFLFRFVFVVFVFSILLGALVSLTDSNENIAWKTFYSDSNPGARSALCSASNSDRVRKWTEWIFFCVCVHCATATAADDGAAAVLTGV